MSQAPNLDPRGVYLLLQEVERNDSNPTKRRFLIDKTPYHDDDSRKTQMVTTEDQERFFIVIGRILPTSRIYGRGAFEMEIKIPIEFPFQPPKLRLLTPIHHPNIEADGKFAHSST
jgi:ubiquitin-protein ligase